MALCETPSRIWRRIQDEREPSSLPSLPAFEHSTAPETESDPTSTDDGSDMLPIHSTPAAFSSHTVTSTIRLQSSTSSTARFASSIASRSVSAKSSVSRTYGRLAQESFDVSAITSLPQEGEENTDPEDARLMKSTNSVPEAYLPPLDGDEVEDMSLVDALESVSRASSPLSPKLPPEDPTPKKGLKYDYSISLRSELQPSPIDKYRNVALRRPLARTRTPSLSHTTSSPSSSPPNSTPRSNRSLQLPAESPIQGIYVPLPRSASASPAISTLPSVVVQPLGYDSRSSEEELPVSPRGYKDQLDESEPEKASDADDGVLSDREPTFSSASSDPSYPVNRTVQPTRSPVAPSTAFSSPAPSAIFTPTPAIVQRPRPRFNLPPPPQDLDAQEDHESDAEPVTPHTRRRSFLLSVINSTARPRMKVPTPHPHRRLSALPVNSENETDVQETPPLRKAFVGITPRPGRGRMSHPLAQTFLPDGDSSEAGSGNNVSPYDAAGERASFISTASSHDLATHVRANTSYDPAIGLGERGKMGRFDAQKLNAYLHGLNRRLQEENLSLVERLQKYEEVKQGHRVSIESTGRGRRISAGVTLGDVEEESGAEGWAEEKLELEVLVQEMEVELDQTKAETAQVSKDLEKERNERARDKERWRERMEEVEKGVSEIVGELERKVEEAERERFEAVEEISKANREADKVREHLQTERDLAVERAAKAESAMESGKELGGALNEANSKVGTLSSDLHTATAQIKELEEEVMAFDRKVNELEKELKEEKLSSKLAAEDFHSQLSEMGTEVMRATARVTELEKDVAERDMALQCLEDELEVKSDELIGLQRCIARSDTETAAEVRALKVYTAELEESTAERVKILEGQLAAAQDCVDQYEADGEHVNHRMESLEKETEKATELARQMEEALEAAEEKMKTDEEMLANLRIKLASLERERERQRDPSIGDQQSNHEVEEALEAELDEANEEIARLTTLLNQSPARRAIEKAKDARIEMLEGENEELIERVRSLKSTNAEMTTPSRVVNMSGISPIHRHVLSMNLKTPKTPGGPLRDLSWLNNTTADPGVSPLLAEIARLQTELDRANESIDHKLDELQEAGLGVIDLTKNLADARSQTTSLENEIARLQRREERRLRRLEKLRCQKCFMKIDPSKLQRVYEADESSQDISHSCLPSNPPTPPTKTSEALRLELHSVNAHLDVMKKQWQDEKRQLLGEKAVLQDAANRMDTEVRNAKDEARRATEAERASRRSRADTQGEAERAKSVIADLEAELQAERMRLRQMSTEQERLQREVGEVARQLQRTETDMKDVKSQLQKTKQDNYELEDELRVNTNADQKARLLETRVLENTSTIEQLRQERSLLAQDHKDLQRRFAEVSERSNKLRNDYAVSQKSHENRRQQLDIHLEEIDELRRALSNQADEFQRTEQEKNRIVMEKTDIARTITALEADLKRVRKDAEIFGRDLKALRAEKERSQEKQKEEVAKAERTKKQAQTQIRLLNEQLENQKTKAKKAREELQRHVCPANGHQLEELKVQHKHECKGLIVQIRYLKAKFTRESTLRDDLSYQKQYLLILLSGFEASENRILACIAQIGFPKPPPVAVLKKRRSLKGVTLCIIFIRRAKCSSDAWRKACGNKQAIVEALEEVRRRRLESINPPCV
ncbi:hypothetical protein PAXRUDRAFT_831297 [Paxillus rubicundulus Ve08.2h10]|uniref:Pericentrin/AKAP-450 centrosomal targeting domain-containing protein n=1 Tax=Paxillus rubicundulus Ve08.2h10 TaxID=930991 RepID=A0A0D0DX95_9AGAM|nr:hypothetical protein PAXRUDRAFT_831297 [Paxillus rubicundulus Ve08.2h10]